MDRLSNTFWCFGIVVALFIGCTSTPAPEEDTPAVATVRTSIDDLVEQIAVGLDGEPRNIGVTPPEGDETHGEFLQDEIIAAFLRARFPGLEIYERSRLNVLLEEAAFGISGLVAEETAVDVGNMVGVDGVVVASILEVGDLFSISARLVDTTTGRIIGAGSVDIRVEILRVSGDEQTGPSLLENDFSVRELVLRPDLQPDPETAVHRITTTDGMWTEYDSSGRLTAQGSLEGVTESTFKVRWVIPETFNTTEYNFHTTPDSIVARVIVDDYEIGYIELVE